MESGSDALQDHEIHALIAGDAAAAVAHAQPEPIAVAHVDVQIKATTPAEVTAPPRAYGSDLQLMDASGMGISVAELHQHASDRFLASEASHASKPDMNAFSDLTKLQPEVLQWMDQCRAANGGIAASEDDVLYYFDTKYPELLEPEASERTFTWLHGFLAGLVTHDEPPRFSNEVKAVALHTLAASPEATTALVVELGLKSTTTLQYWKLEQAKLMPRAASVTSPSVIPRPHGGAAGKRRSPFVYEKQLVEWLLSHKHTPITNQDIVNHLQTQYPSFVEGRSSASMSVWVARFLKRHLPSESSSGGGIAPGLGDHVAAGSESEGKDDAMANPPFQSSSLAVGTNDDDSRKRRAKRKSPNGYVLHSNEFKLNALKKLDEGKTVSEVAEELGIKCPNTLVYWNSIRDKLAVADKKRFRLAGGGRRSTCTFEDELMNWVGERHQKGLGTDVKTVLDYLHEFHPHFTAGKKEPTLRKWILRFFKRFRQPSAVTGADDDLDKADGILV